MRLGSLLLAMYYGSAGALPLDEQLKCICLSQTTCDLSRPQSFIFSNKTELGYENYFISSDRPARILKISGPRPQTDYEESMGWINLGTQEQPRIWVLHFDSNGRIRYHQMTDQTPWDQTSQLGNWLEVKRYEEILIQNGIPLEKKRFDMGTWLLRQSDAVGILPAEGLREGDGNLTEVIKKYHDESRFPFRNQAYEFQLKYRDFFKDCNPKEGLCDIQGWSELPFQEVQDAKSKTAWESFYKSRLSANLTAKPAQDLSPQCREGVELLPDRSYDRPQSIRRGKTQ